MPYLIRMAETEALPAFELSRVNPNPARFDLKKCEAINASHLRALSPDDLAERTVPYLQAAGLLLEHITPEQRQTLLAAAPLIQERMTTLAESVHLLGFLFVPDHAFAVDEADAATLLDGGGLKVVRAAEKALLVPAASPRASAQRDQSRNSAAEGALPPASASHRSASHCASMSWSAK